MYFEIIETYPETIVGSNFCYFNIPVSVNDDKKPVRENLKAFIKNDDQGSKSPEGIDAFLEFCEETLSMDKKETPLTQFFFNIDTLELTSFVKSHFKVIPTSAKIQVSRSEPNRMSIIFSHESSSVTDVKFNLGISTFYFMFSALINIRNYIEYNSHGYTSSIKKNTIKYKSKIDKVFDELIVNDIFKGLYPCRLRRSVEGNHLNEQTVMTAISKSCNFYGVRSYSMFTVNDYVFMLFEQNNNEEIPIFEYKFKNLIYNLE